MAMTLLPFFIFLSSATFSSGSIFPELPPLPAPLIEASELAQRLLPRSDRAGAAHEFLKAHNELRKSYGVKPLRWNRGLARAARRWAFKMRNTCDLTHSPTLYGENIFIGQGRWTIKEAVEEWAKEKHYYHWKDNSCNPDRMCGHFTQMIWDKTEAVGCAKIRCNATFVFITCDYSPIGNIRGRWPVKNYQQFLH